MLVTGHAIIKLEGRPSWWRDDEKIEFDPVQVNLCVATATKTAAMRLYVLVRIITGPAVDPFEIELQEPRDELLLTVTWDEEGVRLGQSGRRHTTQHPW